MRRKQPRAIQSGEYEPTTGAEPALHQKTLPVLLTAGQNLSHSRSNSSPVDQISLSLQERGLFMPGLSG